MLRRSWDALRGGLSKGYLNWGSLGCVVEVVGGDLIYCGGLCGVLGEVAGFVLTSCVCW